MAKKQEYTFIDELLDRELLLEAAEHSFSCVEDPRSTNNRKYSLYHILLMSLAAVIGGANTLGAIHQYIEIQEEFLKSCLGLRAHLAMEHCGGFLQELIQDS